METAVIVLVDGGAGGGPIFPVSAAPLAPVVEETQPASAEKRVRGGGDEEKTALLDLIWK